MILRAIFAAQGSVSLDSIFGAVCAYLLLGMAWGSLYAVIKVLQPGSFQATGAIANALKSAEARGPVLDYYSFVTMTTVGYGDITPGVAGRPDPGVAGSDDGPIYIAVLVAGLVGIRLSQGMVKRDGNSAS